MTTYSMKAIGPLRQIGVGSVDITALEKQYVLEALDNNRLSAGPFTARFEAAMAQAHGCRFGIMCNSGTSALHIALAALKEQGGWQDEDEVIVPALTFIATANIVLYNGLRPVFVDVDPATYNLDPALLGQKITKRTRAIIPVHLFGLPCEMDPILQIARAHDLRVLEDSCETMFSTYKGRPVGSFGDIGCFSTYAAHILVTGVGGIATTSNQDLALVMKSFMNHGRDSIYLHIDDDSEVEPEKLFRIANGRFSFVRLGRSFRATEMEAALGLAQMSRKEEILGRRRMNAQFLTDGLRDMQNYIQLPSCPAQSEHAYMMYPILIKEERIRRSEFIQYLEQNLIETRYMLPLLNQPIFKKIFGDIEPEYPVAQHINDHGFYVGCHPGLTEGDLMYMVEKIRAFISRALA